MKRIEKDELYQHLSGFFKRKGVILTEGSYAQTVQKSCALLTDVVNCSHEGLKRVKGEIDKRLDQVRRVIHEKTAPKPPRAAGTAAAAPPPTPEPGPVSVPGAAPRRPRAKPKRATRKGGARKSKS